MAPPYSTSEIRGYYLSIALLLGLTAALGDVCAQDSSRSSYLFRRARLNTGFTHWEIGSVEFQKVHEVTWSNQVSVSITEKLYVGLLVYSIFISGDYILNESYLLTGVFSHYDFISINNHIAFVELSYSQGDYCFCGSGDPYRFPDLQYIGFGLGGEIPILRSNFYAQGSFVAHIIAGSAEDKYEFIIYKLGLTYRWGQPKRERSSLGIPISRLML